MEENIDVSPTTISQHSGSRTRNSHASIACTSCKVAKKRCDQGHPCSNCRKNNRSCVYVAEQDARRAAVRKRKTEDLQRRAQSLDALIEVLKNTPQAQSEHIVDMIRQDQPLDKILELLNGLPTPPPHPQSPNPSRHGRNPLSISVLVDIPTVQVPASPWTRVTGDSSAVSHLMSAYLNWCHHHYYFFDEELFVDAMKKGDLASPFCSPLLVNACLGIGCLWTDEPCAFEDPDDMPGTRAEHYFNEANHLWIEAAARPSLVNFQGLFVLIMLSALCGKDRVSYMLLPQLPTMMQQVLVKSGKDQSPAMQKSLKLMQWMNFICQVAFGISGLQPAAALRPRDELPFDITHNLGSPTWSAYPLVHPTVRIDPRVAFNGLCEVSSIGAEIQNAVYGSKFSKLDGQSRFDTARSAHYRLLEWHESLPKQYQYQEPEYIVSAPTVDLTMSYFHFVHHCYQSILSKDLHLDKSTKEIEGLIKAKLLNIAFAERDLIRRFKEEYGPTSYSLLMPQPVNVTLHILFDYIDTHGVQELFLELFGILVESGRRWRITKGLLRVLLGTIDEKGGAIPAALREKLNRDAEGLWKPDDHLHFSSKYPNYVLAREKLETLEMSDLLEQWAELRFGTGETREGGEKEAEAEIDAAGEGDDGGEEGDGASEKRGRAMEGSIGARKGKGKAVS